MVYLIDISTHSQGSENDAYQESDKKTKGKAPVKKGKTYQSANSLEIQEVEVIEGTSLFAIMI